MEISHLTYKCPECQGDFLTFVGDTFQKENNMVFCCYDCYEKYYERKRLLKYRKDKLSKIINGRKNRIQEFNV